MNLDAEKFLAAQEGKTFYPAYETALGEIRRGCKTSHWIWYVFPQLYGLGYSSTANYYGIQNLQEAREYMQHPVLGSRLVEISQALYEQKGPINYILPSPDDLKVCSCMTLFREASPETDIFQKVLDKFYNGKPDRRTLGMLKPL